MLHVCDSGLNCWIPSVHWACLLTRCFITRVVNIIRAQRRSTRKRLARFVVSTPATVRDPSVIIGVFQILLGRWGFYVPGQCYFLEGSELDWRPPLHAVYNCSSILDPSSKDLGRCLSDNLVCQCEMYWNNYIIINYINVLVFSKADCPTHYSSNS